MQRNHYAIAVLSLLSAWLGAGTALAAPARDGDSLLTTSWPAEDVCAWPGQAGSFRAGLAEADPLEPAGGLCAGTALTAYPAPAIPDDMPTQVPEAPSYLLLLSGCGLILLKRRRHVQAEPWANQPVG
jgi:hypothetical protein